MVPKLTKHQIQFKPAIGLVMFEANVEILLSLLTNWQLAELRNGENSN